MQAKVDKDLCISCGMCVSSLPEVFSFDDDSLAEATGVVTEEIEEECIDVADGCPVGAITVNK